MTLLSDYCAAAHVEETENDTDPPSTLCMCAVRPPTFTGYLSSWLTAPMYAHTCRGASYRSVSFGLGLRDVFQSTAHHSPLQLRGVPQVRVCVCVCVCVRVCMHVHTCVHTFTYIVMSGYVLCSVVLCCAVLCSAMRCRRPTCIYQCSPRVPCTPAPGASPHSQRPPPHQSHPGPHEHSHCTERGSPVAAPPVGGG